MKDLNMAPSIYFIERQISVEYGVGYQHVKFMDEKCETFNGSDH